MENEYVGDLLREKRKSKRRSNIAIETLKNLNEHRDYGDYDKQYAKHYLETVTNTLINWLNTRYCKLENYLNESNELVSRVYETNATSNQPIDETLLNDEQKAFMKKYDLNEDFLNEIISNIIKIQVKEEVINSKKRLQEFQESKLKNEINESSRDITKNDTFAPTNQFLKDPREVTKILQEYLFGV